ncbi:Copper homeostasis protein CutC [compost metagenome]
MDGLEVCANSFTSALLAQAGGAIRVELCENMAEGGTTPSFSQIKHSVEQLHIEVWPIIRPRGGDFLYTEDEFELMKTDIALCKSLQCNGVVFGILKANGDVDLKRCAELVALASPMPVTFHRAFDRSNNLSKSLEDIINLGFTRILSSGAAQSAQQGIHKLAELIKQADHRISIMPGAGINPSNILEIKEQTGATLFHSSARRSKNSLMQYQVADMKSEDQYEQSDLTLIKEMVAKLNSTSK